MEDKDLFDLRRNRKVKLRTLQLTADKLRLQLETGERYFNMTDAACIKAFLDTTKEIERLCKVLNEPTDEAPEPYLIGEIPVMPGSTFDKLNRELMKGEKKRQ